jgi:VIT1/CCC1 family predicted Fe2+/Mn2+ transporter
VDTGLTPPLAREVAEALTRGDALAVHAREELNIDVGELAKPLQASISSALSFAAGAALPLAAIALTPAAARLPVTLVVATVALGILGGWSASRGGAPVRPAVARVLAGGLAAMALTMALGTLFGAAP